MAESLNRAFESLRELIDGLGWGTIADSPVWTALWKTAVSLQGVAFIATVFAALGLGILAGRLWARPRPPVPAAQPVAAPSPDLPPPDEPRLDAPPPPDAPATALRAALQSRGLSDEAVAMRVETFVAGLTKTRAVLGNLLGEDAETAPLIETAARAFDSGDFDGAVRNLDLARGRFGASGRALANQAGSLRLAAATAATLAGDLEMSRCDYTAAAKLFARALERLQETEAARVVALLTKQATAVFRSGGAAEADTLLQRAVRVAEQTHGAENPEVAKALGSLAFVRFATGKPVEAEQLYRRALAIDETALGADHPDVATDQSNLAQLMLRQGNLPAAEPLLKRALAIRQNALGPAHPETLRAARNYADLLRRTNRPQDANQVLAAAALARRQAERAAE